MRYQALKRKPLTEAQARKNMMIYLKNMAGLKMDFFKGMTYSEIRPIFEKHYNSIQAFLEKEEKEIKEEGSKRKGKSLKQDTTKKQRIDKDVEELKRHLRIVANDDDDVYIEATPLPSKLVKERFKSIEPKNFSDDFLLNILKIMFEKPNVEANMFLLVEKKYPLTRFTLEQMLNNVRLEVKEESEMSLELLRELGDEEVVVGEGVVVISSSPDMLTNSCLGGIMVCLIFLEGLDEEALVEFMALGLAQFHELELDIPEHQFLFDDGCET
nr:hypothetical protein [Tanacetum cinerariifolium]